MRSGLPALEIKMAAALSPGDRVADGSGDPPPLPARNGANSVAPAPTAQEEISPVTILPHDVIEKLAELDLELSEGKGERNDSTPPF